MNSSRKSFILTMIIIAFTISTPFISTYLINPDNSGFENENLSKAFTEQTGGTKAQTEFSKAPSLNSFLNKDDSYLSSDRVLPIYSDNLTNLNAENTAAYNYDEDLIANIDLQKYAFQTNEIVNYSIQVTSGLEVKSNYDIQVIIIQGDNFYHWYYNFEPITTISDFTTTTNSEGFYYGSFTPATSGLFTILVIPYRTSYYPIARRVVTVSDIGVFWRVPYNAVEEINTSSYAMVTNTTDFSPLADANITLELENYYYDNTAQDYISNKTKLYSGQTDSNGLITLDYCPSRNDSTYSYLVLTTQYLETTVEINNYIWFHNYYWYSEDFAKYDFITTTDKPIYQPGDTVKTRTIVYYDNYWAENKTPVINASVEVEFKNYEGFILYHEILQTNEFGIIDWDFNFDIEAEIGLYSLQFNLEGSKSNYEIELDYYEKPDFRITIDLESEYVEPGDKIKGTISAEYYFGKPVLGSLELTFSYFDSILETISTQLNSDGKYTFSWKIPRKNPYSDTNFETIKIEATVEDPINRIVTASSEVICNSDIYAYFWTDPYGIFNKGEDITAYYNAYQISAGDTYGWYSYSHVSDATAKISIYGLINSREKFLFSIEGVTDEFGSGQLTFTIDEQYYNTYRYFLLKLEISTEDGRSGESERSISVATIRTDIELSPNSNLSPGDTIDVTISVLNTETNNPESARVYIYVMDAEFDTIYYIWDFDLDGSTTFSLKLSDYAPNGTYRINAYCRIYNWYSFNYTPRYSSGFLEFEVGQAPSLELTTDKINYSSSEIMNISILLNQQNNVPTIIELTKRGIVEYYLINHTETNFTLSIFDLEQLAPKLTIFAFSITPTGFILESYLVINIIREINVEINPDKDIYEPGETATIDIQATDDLGNNIDAISVFSLIDSSIFAVKEDSLAENDYFEDNYYWSQISTRTSWTSIMSQWWYWWFLVEPAVYVETYATPVDYFEESLFTFGGSYQEVSESEIKIRDNLPESASWISALNISNGSISLDIQLPDNIGEWTVRLFVHTSGYGVVAKETFKTFKPFFVDLKIPQTIVQDDVIIVKGIAYNYLNQSAIVNLSLTVDGLITLNDPIQEVNIPEDYLVEVRWSVYCNDISYQNITLTGITTVEDTIWSDGIRKTAYIKPNGVEYSTVESGFLNSSKIIDFIVHSDSIDLDSNLVISPGILDVAFTSWERLIGYPYGCIEQTMSKVFADVLIYQYLNQTGQLTPDVKNSLDAMLQAGISKIASLQHADGGWGWWEDDDSQSYMTALVLYGLGLLRTLGYEIPSTQLLKAVNYISFERNSNGSFSTDVWDLDDLSFTAFVIRALILNDISNTIYVSTIINAINYFEVAWKAGLALKNSYAAALFIDGTIDTQFEDTKFYSILESYILADANIELEGLRWELDSTKTWRSLGGDIETTSVVITALSKLDFIGNFLYISKAVNWLMSQQNYYGWGNTADTSAAIKAIVTIAPYESDPIDANITITINDEWNQTLTYNEAVDSYLSADFINLDDILVEGNNSLKLNQTGTGNFYYYFTATQILRTNLEISTNSSIVTNPGALFNVDLKLAYNSTDLYPVNIEIESLEEMISSTSPSIQTIQILTTNQTVSFEFEAPTTTGEYSLGGFKVSYLFADTSLNTFSTGIIMQLLDEIQLIVQSEATLRTAATNKGSTSYRDDFLVRNSDANITIDRDFVNPSTIDVGDTIEITIDIQNNWESKDFVMIEEWLPAGFTVLESSLQVNTNIAGYSISSTKLTFFISKLDIGFTSVSYRLSAVAVGASIIQSAIVSSMYDNWSVESDSSLLGTLNVNINPETGLPVIDSYKPVLLDSSISYKERETHFEVSISIDAYDNDEVASVTIYFAGKNDLWQFKEAILIEDLANNSKSFSTYLSQFANEELHFIIAIEDRSGNVLYTATNSYQIPSLAAKAAFIILVLLVAFGIASFSFYYVSRLKPRYIPEDLYSDDIKGAKKASKEDRIIVIEDTRRRITNFVKKILED